MSRNTITIQQGRIGKDPELKTSQKGVSHLVFQVCTSDSWHNGTEWVNEKNWFDVKVFGKVAERVAAEARRGGEVHLRGHMKLEEWESRDQETGATVKRTRWYVIPDPQFLYIYPPKQRAEQSDDDFDARKGYGQQQRQPAARQQQQRPYSGDASEYAGPPDDDDVPF